MNYEKYKIALLMIILSGFKAASLFKMAPRLKYHQQPNIAGREDASSAAKLNKFSRTCSMPLSAGHVTGPYQQDM